MQISIIKENHQNEQRVSSTPDVITLLKRIGAEVLIEKGAGDLSGFGDELYKSNGAKIVNRSECFQSDICLCVRMPSQNDINQMKQGSILIGILDPYQNKNFFHSKNQ